MMTAEMAQQPEILQALIDRADVTRAHVREVLPQPLHGVALVARGSSDNAALYGRYLLELTAGVPAGLVAPSIHTRYRSRVDYRGQLVIALSQSGATPEIVSAAQRLRAAGARTIAVTNDGSSELAAVCEVSLPVAAGPERAVPATKTVTAQMLMLALIASALGDPPFADRELAALPRAAAQLLGDDRPASGLASEWAAANRLMVVARGLMLGAALETALKIRETAAVHAEGMSSADLLHGPIAALDAELPVLMLRGGPATNDDLYALGRRLQVDGVPSAEWAPAPELPEALAPIAATVRGQQLARAWALQRERDPDAPAGLSKVTATR